jgi:hypothetical protein
MKADGQYSHDVTSTTTRRLICQRKLLQITAGESRRFSMRGLPVSRGCYLASIVIDLHNIG